MLICLENISLAFSQISITLSPVIQYLPLASRLHLLSSYSALKNAANIC